MRMGVIDALRSLADREYQERVWINRIYPHERYYDDLSMRIHTLYDDTDVLAAPAGMVGDVIYSSEIDSLHQLDSILSPLIDELGDADDSTYLADPRWDQVIRASDAALRTMLANEKTNPD